MMDHPHICIETDAPLSDDMLMCWMRSVTEAGPPGILSSTEISPGRNLQFYRLEKDGTNRYVAVLARDLLTEEATEIAKSFDGMVRDGDFTIRWSQEPTGNAKIDEISEDILKAIALEASKNNHNSWVRTQADQGWRYATAYDRVAKTSPMCVDWDRLPDRYRKGELHRMMSLLDVLDQMNLRIVK